MKNLLISLRPLRSLKSSAVNFFNSYLGNGDVVELLHEAKDSTRSHVDPDQADEHPAQSFNGGQAAFSENVFDV